MMSRRGLLLKIAAVIFAGSHNDYDNPIAPKNRPEFATS